MGKTKDLSLMTLEELWQLFPIILTEHQERWEEWYIEEVSLLKEKLPMKLVDRISPIGSPAIPGIWAKPTIDILVEITKTASFAELKPIIECCGYRCMAETGQRTDFNKGYTPNGFAERVFHLHLRQTGDNDELYFRDYLNSNPAAAKEYEHLKLRLWKLYEHDRDAYTLHKSDFVKSCTEMGKQLFNNKYGTKY